MVPGAAGLLLVAHLILGRDRRGEPRYVPRLAALPGFSRGQQTADVGKTEIQQDRDRRLFVELIQNFSGVPGRMDLMALRTQGVAGADEHASVIVNHQEMDGHRISMSPSIHEHSERISMWRATEVGPV